MNSAAKLRRLLEDEQLVVAPGCHDPLSAKIVEHHGFSAVYLGGWATGAQLGITEPLTSLVEMSMKAKYITDLVQIPLIVDADACFGNATMARRTVREFEKAGVAAIHIEDQVTPKRPSYHKGEHHLVPVSEMLTKIKVSLESRSDNGLIIIARTDAGRNKDEDFSRAVERANIYAEAGADMLMVFPRTMEEVRLAPKEIHAPLVFVASEGLGRPIPTLNELQELGYRLVIYPLSSVLSMVKAVSEFCRALKETGTPGRSREEMESLAAQVMQLIALPELYEIEKRSDG